MSKTYSDAYTLGQKDGETGQNKLPWHAFKRMFTNVGVYLPGAGNRDDEWIKGYRQGFEDRVRELRIVQSNATKEDQMNSLNHGMGNPSNIPSATLGSSGGSGGNGGQGNNLATRIAAAQSLYETIVKFGKFVDETNAEYENVFVKHKYLLLEEYFDSLQESYVKPRISQLVQLQMDLSNQDTIFVRQKIQEYHQAASGLVNGLVLANKYFTDTDASIPQNNLSSIPNAEGGDVRDLNYQLAIAKNIKTLFENLRDQVDLIGKSYDACTKSHDQVFLQHFQYFIDNHAAPRLQDMSDIWRNINNKDIVAIDDLINRLLRLV